MIVLLALVLSLAAQGSPVTVQQVAAPEKALRFEVTVPAPLDEVWAAFTTQDGMQSWLWKETRVDLRPGGEWIVQYTPTATGGGTIVSVAPRAEIVIRALAPEQFPAVRQARTTAAFRFEAAGPKATRVTLLQTGWQTGEEWDAAYAYLAKGNAQLLAQLHERFVSGPIDWSKYK
jgi:uncharacterized protein YndB with AHSA1/START domain